MEHREYWKYLHGVLLFQFLFCKAETSDLIEDELSSTERSRDETPADEDCPDRVVVRDDLEGGQDDVRDGGTADHHPVPQPPGQRVLLPGPIRLVGGNPEGENYLKLPLLTMFPNISTSMISIFSLSMFVIVISFSL